MNPPTDREKALAEALEILASAAKEADLGDAIENDEDRVAMVIDWLSDARRLLRRFALTAPTPAAPTDGPSDSQMLDWVLTNSLPRCSFRSSTHEEWHYGDYATAKMHHSARLAIRAAMEAQP